MSWLASALVFLWVLLYPGTERSCQAGGSCAAVTCYSMECGPSCWCAKDDPVPPGVCVLR